MMRTFNRGKLRKLVEAGRVEMTGAYSFDDMTGAELIRDKRLPVRMHPGDWHDCQQGTCYLHEHDFKSKSGRAWENPNGTVTLVVHSNCNYDLRILPEEVQQ